MNKESEEFAAQLLDKLRTITRQIEALRSEANRIQELNSDYQHDAWITGWGHEDPLIERRLYHRQRVSEMEKIADQVNERLTKLNVHNGVVAQLEQAINNLPEVQEMKRKNDIMKETNELEKRELELKKSIVSKQVESEKISKGLRRLVGFSSVLVISFTTVGILFPYTWVLCVTTIFVGIITLFMGFNMLLGLQKEGILDTGKLEKDKVELDYVQTKKAQLFLESNQ